jgi:hypothetical protein
VSARSDDRAAYAQWLNTVNVRHEVRQAHARAAARVTDRNARTVQRVDHVLSLIVRGILLLLVVMGSVWALLTYAEPCVAGTLCMAVVGMPRRARTDTAPAEDDLSPESHLGATPMRPPLPPNPLERLVAAMNDAAELRCRAHYVAGFRWGWVSGVCSAAATTAVALAVAAWAGIGF